MTITSGNLNGKLFKISLENEEYNVSVYNREEDEFISEGAFRTLEEAQQYLEDKYGTHN